MTNLYKIESQYFAVRFFFEVLQDVYLQNPDLYFFANVIKMPKDIKNKLKTNANTIKSVLKSCVTFAKNNF